MRLRIGYKMGQEHDPDRVRRATTNTRLRRWASPFTSPRLMLQAVTALRRAEAMGLLPGDEHMHTLDVSSLRKAVRHIQRAGMARHISSISLTCQE